MTRRDARRCGTRYSYQQGCRCFGCRLAANRYEQTWRTTGGVRVPVGPVAAHIRALVKAGWTKQAIATEAGVGKDTPWYVTSGRSKTVNARTAAAILGIRLPEGPVTLDARPLIAAVEARGLPVTHLLEGNDRRAFYRAKQSGRISDRAADRIAVAALHMTLDELYGPAWDNVA